MSKKPWNSLNRILRVDNWSDMEEEKLQLLIRPAGFYKAEKALILRTHDTGLSVMEKIFEKLKLYSWWDRCGENFWVSKV